MIAVVHSGEDIQGEVQVCAWKLEEARDRADDAEKVHRDHQEIRLGDAAVEEFTVDDSPLGGHVEAAKFGVDEGEHGGKEEVWSEDGLVDLVPEGVAVLALDARVGDVEENEVREGVGEDGRPESRDVDVAEAEVD